MKIWRVVGECSQATVDCEIMTKAVIVEIF